MHRVASAGWHLLALGYAAFVACATMLPTGTDLGFFVFDVEELIRPRLVGRLVAVSASVGGLALAVVAWRRRHIWITRLSTPLLAYVVVCGIGLAMCVLISQPPRYLARLGLGGLRGITEGLDVRHMISYFGFAVIAAIAWRGRASLPLLGALLMAYGYGLELLQEFIPSRKYRGDDLVSNGLGVLLGLCWVYLYDSLFGPGTALSRPAGRRRGGALAQRESTRAGVQSSGS